jgi:arginyl-tRNA synthetase
MLKLKQQVAEILGAEISIPAEELLPLLERPQRAEHGDIAFPCFQLAKAQRKAPPAIAAELAKNISAKLPDSISEVKALGPYLNFRVSQAAATEFLVSALKDGNDFGASDFGAKEKVLLEFGSPNVAKPLHIGHFRNHILGQSLVNIYKKAGFTVTTINHLGDWGSQFGKVAYAFQNWGDEHELEKNTISYLVQLYVKFHEEEEKHPEKDLDREARLMFKKIENGDPELTKLWKHFCDLSIADLKRTYARLGIAFDNYVGESFYVDKIEAALHELKAKNLLVESEGAQIVNLEAHDMPPCLMITGDGTTLYATRDLAAALWRKKHFGFDRCLYVVGSEQKLHLAQVFKVVELLGHKWAANLEHVSYGLYRFKDGKFSTRKGKIILLNDVVDEACEKAAAVIEAKNPNLANKSEVAEMIGLGAVVYNDLSTDRVKDVEFDWDKILDFEGDTGPYVQYSHARASSILRQAAGKSFQPKFDAGAEALASESTLSLLKLFGRFEETILGAVRLNKPSIVANYALELARGFSAFYHDVRVIDESLPKKEVEARLAIVDGYRSVLRCALALLTMRAPEEM